MLNRSNFRNLIVAANVLLFPSAILAAPITFFGADERFATENADNAFTQWEQAAGSYTLDNLDGISGGGFGASVTSALGNKFTSTDDFVSTLNFDFTVLQGISLRLSKVGNETDFVWDIAESVDSFGFFSRGNDGGTITVSFEDNSVQSFSFVGESTPSNGDNFFWGITNLEGTVKSVSITSTDPGTTSNGGNSSWDRFVYRPASTTNVNPASAPTIFSLVLIGALMMFRKNVYK